VREEGSAAKEKALLQTASCSLTLDELEEWSPDQSKAYKESCRESVMNRMRDVLPGVSDKSLVILVNANSKLSDMKVGFGGFGNEYGYRL